MNSIRLSLSCFLTTLALASVSPSCEAGPIHDAIKGGNLHEVARLLDSGTDINERVEHNKFCTETALLTAVRKKQIDIVHELLIRGANVKARQQGGLNVLHYAAYNGHADMMELLLDSGDGALELINNGIIGNELLVDPITPLHIAIDNCHTEVARILIDHGANVNIKDHSGKTPLHLAAGGGFDDIVCLLISKGANVNAATFIDKHTPLQIARSAGHKNIMDILIGHGANLGI